MIDPETVEDDEDLRDRLIELFEDSAFNDEPLTEEQGAAIDRLMGHGIALSTGKALLPRRQPPDARFVELIAQCSR